MNSFTKISAEIEKTRTSSFPQVSAPGLATLPLLLQPHELVPYLDDEKVLIIDVRVPETCVDGHIPGTVSLPYLDLLRVDGTAKGLLPTAARLTELFSGIGLTPEMHVVAYDDDSGTAASRLLWTLDVVGHKLFSLLNSEFAAWDDAELPLVNKLTQRIARSYPGEFIGNKLVEYDDMLLHIDNPHVVILYTRSEAEYVGEDVRAQRGGHIPSAVNIDWINLTDPFNNFQIRSKEELRSIFLSRRDGG